MKNTRKNLERLMQQLPKKTRAKLVREALGRREDAEDYTLELEQRSSNTVPTLTA